MIKIGLTGGIGSGKSVVSVLFELMGIPVYIADEESKKLTNTSPAIRTGLTRLFGKDIYTDGGGLDKKRLASLIFSDEKNRHLTNAIIHPEVNRHFLWWVSQQASPLCAIETAILFESGFNKDVDYAVMVYAPLELRLERTAARDNASREEITRRINSQMPDEDKKNRADYIIYNDGCHALIPQVAALLATVHERHQ